MYVPSHKIMILLLRWQVAMERTFCTVSWETSLSGSPYGSGTPLSLMQCSWRDPRDLFVQGAHHVLNLLRHLLIHILNLLRHLLIHVLISLKDICKCMSSSTLSKISAYMWQCPLLSQWHLSINVLILLKSFAYYISTHLSQLYMYIIVHLVVLLSPV